MLASLAATYYQAKHKIIFYSWNWLLVIVAAGLLAAVIILALGSFR